MHTAILAILLAIPLVAGTPTVTELEAYGRLPLSFEANQGQWDANVKFVSRGKGYALFLTQGEAVLALRDATLRLSLVGASAPDAIEALEELPGKVNYLVGRSPDGWRKNIPTYARIRYEEVWPGIDMVFYGNHGRLEYDFVVRPGADPARVRLRFDGADALRLEDGRFVATAGGGEVVQLAPVVYQEIEGKRREVAGAYRLEGREIAFELAAYDKTQALVIDPIMIYASFLGGGEADAGRGITVDKDRNAYLTGVTLSPNFPTQDPAQGAIGGTQSDAFVTKINAAGSATVYSTYLGGAGSGDIGYDIALDEEGSVYIAGVTSSTDFPTTAGVIQGTLAGNRDAFVAKLSADGSQLVYSTLLGGSRSDIGFGIAVNSAGEAFVTGDTASDEFPVTAGVFQPTRNGPASPIEDAFISRLNADATSLIYSTYVGGTDMERGHGIAIDSDNHAYVTGVTGSDDFPATAGSVQPGNGGTNDAFVLKLSSTGDALAYATYLGGSNIEGGYGIALDFANNAYIVGDTQSRDFPATPNVVQPEWVFNVDAFVAKLNQTGSELVYATYLGGSAKEHGQGITVDTATTAYVTGWTASTNFPEANPLENTKGDSGDAFVARLSHDATFLHFSTYYGGDLPERVGDTGGNAGGNPIAIDDRCHVYSTGMSVSPNLPLKDAFQPVIGGDDDAFVLKLDPFVENDGPSINCRGVVLATQTPVVRMISPNSIVTAFGDEFTGGPSSVTPPTDGDGNVARKLADTCVELNDVATPMFAGLDTQANFQAHRNLPAGWAKVRIVRNCGLPDEVKSPPEYVQVAATSPAFFNFVNNADGVNPIAALHQDGVGLVGRPGLFGAAIKITEASPEEFVSLFFTGGGETNPSFAEGELPGVAAPVTAPVELTIGGVPVVGGDLLYVGVAPGFAGLYQAVGKVPAGAQTGNHEVRLKIGDYTSPPGPFIAVKAE